jgi:hypothetical protein
MEPTKLMVGFHEKTVALLHVNCIILRMDLFSSKSGNADATRAVKRWAAECRPELDEVVHVAELRCHEEGCPDFETVVTWMSSPPLVVKILKPIDQISREDVQAACSGESTTTDPCMKEHP